MSDMSNDEPVRSSTRGGWQLYELLGLTEEKEGTLVNEISKALEATQEDVGGKTALIALMPVVDKLPIDEAILTLMFFGRWVGHLEYERNQKQQRGLAGLVSALGGEDNVIVIKAEAPKEVKASDLKGGDL